MAAARRTIDPHTVDGGSREVATLRLGQFEERSLGHGTTRAWKDGRSIEIEHGIPGELARVEIVQGRRQRGRIVEVLEASPDRIPPPCVYFRDWSCGGCQWQHIAYGAQLVRKRQDTEEAMRRAGLSVVVDAVHTLDEPWRYRTTAGIALGKRAGFRRHGSLAIVPIEDCPISHPLIGSLMAELNAMLAGGSLPDFRGRVRLDVRIAEDARGPFLQTLIRPDPDRPPDQTALRELGSVLANLASVGSVLLGQTGGPFQVLCGDVFGGVAVAGRRVTLSAASFFQTNLLLLPRLIRRLREVSAPLAGKRVADVYGGIGIFGLFLAAEAEKVVIVESNPIALEAASITAREWGLHNVRCISGRAEEVLESLAGYDVVILDPPRAGLSAPVIDELLHRRPPLILYISCLAQSLARDLVAFTAAGYTVSSLELFDFYPQTYHVELLAVLAST